MKSSVQRSTTSGAIELSIEPPSPAAAVTSQKPLQPRQVLTNGVFPDVPPLMHSPGMRAPPVSNGPATAVRGSGSGRVRVGDGGGGGGRSRRGGKRSPGRTGSPVAGGSPASHPHSGVVETPPSRSWSVPGNVSITKPAHLCLFSVCVTYINGQYYYCSVNACE